MNSTTVDYRNRAQGAAFLGPLQAVIDFVSDELRAAVTSVPSERQVRAVKSEFSSLVWEAVGPLLTTRDAAWRANFERAACGTFLKELSRIARSRAGKRISDEGRRANAAAALRPARTDEEQYARELYERISITLDAIKRHVEIHRPRIPPERVRDELVSRWIVTAAAVAVAGEPAPANKFLPEAVRACRDECLAACAAYAALFGVHNVPETAADRQHEVEQREETERLNRHLARGRAEDDRFALMGD